MRGREEGRGVPNVTRRQVLGGVGTAVATSLTGCSNIPLTGGSSPPTATECEDRGPTRTPFDQELLPLQATECSNPRLRFVSVSPRGLRTSPSFVPVLHPLSEFATVLALPLWKVERASYLWVPGKGWFQFAAFRTAIDRELFRNRLRLRKNAYVNEAESYRSFAVSTSRTPGFRTFGTNETWIGVAPATSAGVEVESRARFERGADALTENIAQYPCAYADVRSLLAGMPRMDFVRTEFRVAPGTVDGGATLPAGSLAGSFGVSVPNATAERIELDLRFAAIYPENAVNRAAFEEHVRTHRTGERASNLPFSNPTFDRSGRILTATESRTIPTPRTPAIGSVPGQ